MLTCRPSVLHVIANITRTWNPQFVPQLPALDDAPPDPPVAPPDPALAAAPAPAPSAPAAIALAAPAPPELVAALLTVPKTLLVKSKPGLAVVGKAFRSECEPCRSEWARWVSLPERLTTMLMRVLRKLLESAAVRVGADQERAPQSRLPNSCGGQPV